MNAIDILGYVRNLILLTILACLSQGCTEREAVSSMDSNMSHATQDELAWDAVDAPSHLDISSDFKYIFAELPTQGAADPVPWAGTYWPTYKDSLNDKWNGPDTAAPSTKYAQAFNKTGIEDAVSANYGIDSQNHRTACTQASDCDSTKNESCSKRAGQDSGFCVETWFGI